MAEVMWDVVVRFPTTERSYINLINDFEKLRRFAHCFEVIDRCHIPIKCPSGYQVSAKEYRKFQNFYSLVIMAIVDSKYRFLSDNCGIPGNSHDSEIFEASELYWQITEQHYTQYGKHWRQTSNYSINCWRFSVSILHMVSETFYKCHTNTWAKLFQLLPF